MQITGGKTFNDSSFEKVSSISLDDIILVYDKDLNRYVRLELGVLPGFETKETFKFTTTSLIDEAYIKGNLGNNEPCKLEIDPRVTIQSLEVKLQFSENWLSFDTIEDVQSYVTGFQDIFWNLKVTVTFSGSGTAPINLKYKQS